MYARLLRADPRRVLVGILGAAILVRIVLVATAWLVTHDAHVFYSPDSNSYIVPARELLESGTFTTHGQPELVRTPGYPLLLVPALWLGHPAAITIMLQIGLSALTVAGVFALARTVLQDARIALLAAAIYAIEPLSIIYTAMLLSETLFAALVVWGLALITVHVRRGTPSALLAGTGLLAVSAYVRPVGYFLPFVLLIALAIFVAIQRNWRAVPRLVLAAVLAALVLAPWRVRNHALGFDGMSAISAQSLYFYQAAAVRAARSGSSFSSVQAAMGYNNDSIYFALHPEQRAWSAGQRFTYQADQGAREVAQNVPLSARMYLSGVVRVLFDPGAIDLLKLYKLYPPQTGLLSTFVSGGFLKGLSRLLHENLLALVLLVLLGIALAGIYALAAAGLVAGRRFADPAVLLLLLTAAYFVAISGGPAALNRFRHPVMPFVCVLAAAGLVYVRRVVARSTNRLTVHELPGNFPVLSALGVLRCIGWYSPPQR